MFSIILFFLYQLSLANPLCEPYQNNCEKCHPLNNLCIKCLLDNYFPDKNGGCEPKCTLGLNYCNECSEDLKLCATCEEGMFPDNIGGCSYIKNCDSSNRGKCLKCKEDFILIGDKNNFQLCKSLNSEDLRHCKNINLLNGFCEECEDNYYLNKGDLKCLDIENCYESIFRTCASCIDGYYLNKKSNKCIKNNENFIHCKQTIDGKNCDICNFGYYLAEDGQCSEALKCLETEKGKCIKCSDNFYLTEDNYCTPEEKCQYGKKDTVICSYCYSGYYLDNKDNKCKIQDNDEYKHCEIYDDGCIECEIDYYKGEDLKCTKTKNCHESENEKCIECKEGYYLGHDNKCSFIEHCIYSGNIYECDECEDGYYFSITTKTCLKSEENFQNCKIAIYDGSKCSSCKNNYYLNHSDYLCYDNTDKEDQFYKCEFTDYKGEKCDKCVDGYYLSSGDEKCLTVNNCKYSKNEKECDVCDDSFCLDVKNQKCVDNDFLEDESQKIYIACYRTNEEGDKCEICLDGYEVNENGFCVDTERCEIKEGGICMQCKDDATVVNGFYCANEIFGCLKSIYYACKQCNNFEDLYRCTECKEGYILNNYNKCIREEES